MGIEKPNAGRVLLEGIDIAGWPTHRIARAGVGIVFQHSRPLHRQTVLENIKLALLPDSLLKLVAEPRGGGARARDRRAGRPGRGARPPPADPAVRRPAPAGDGQGARARSARGADRRTLRRPDPDRGRHLLRADRRLPPRGPRGAAGRPQRQERRRAGRSRAGDVSRRAHRRRQRRARDAGPDRAPGLYRRRPSRRIRARSWMRAAANRCWMCATWRCSTARRRRCRKSRCMCGPGSSFPSSA